MGASSSCCCSKQKPTEKPSSDPPLITCSPQDIETTSMNPSTDPPVIPGISSPRDIETTSINPSAPSTDYLNQLQIVISPTQPSSTTPPESSTPKKSPPTLQEVTSNFEKIDITSQADVFITAIKEILETQKHTQDTPSTSSSHTDKLSNWDSFIHSGGKFLKFANGHTEKIKIDSKDRVFQSGEATKFLGNIVEQIGHVHWAVAGLSIVGYLVSKCVKCLELLQEMLTLVSHIKDLNILIKEERKKFENAFQYIIEGSISCASQLDSGKIFSFLKSSVNSDTLTAIRSKISDLYRDLHLTATIEILQQTPATKDILPQGYPSYAVGIEDQLKAVNELLNMETGKTAHQLPLLFGV